MPERDYTIKQVAAEFQVDEQTVYRMVERGVLEAYRVGTGKRKPAIRITAESLQAYKAKHKVLPQKNGRRETSGENNEAKKVA